MGFQEYRANYISSSAYLLKGRIEMQNLTNLESKTSGLIFGVLLAWLWR